MLRDGPKQPLISSVLPETEGAEGENTVSEDANSNSMIMDSGIDLMASKELPRGMWSFFFRILLVLVLSAIVKQALMFRTGQARYKRAG